MKLGKQSNSDLAENQKKTLPRSGAGRRKQSILILGIVLLGGWLFWGNSWIITTHITVVSTEIPQSFNGYTIAQVSDLHNKDWGDALTNLLKKQAPDVIMITGDLIDASHLDLETAVEFAKQAMTIAPVYFVNGNHEVWSGRYNELSDRLTSLGVQILDNEAVQLEKEDGIIRLLGVIDPAAASGGDEYDEEAELKEALSDLDLTQDIFQILLTHRPENFELYAKTGVDLVLAGHAHGGQFRIPLIGGIIAPDQGFFPRYTAGLYEKDKTRMIVSRGLGNSIIPIRINNNPELVIIKLSR